MATITRLKSPASQPSFTSLPVLAESFRLSLEAQNKSPRTVQTYLEAIARLDSFLVRSGLPHDVTALQRAHLEAFVKDLLDTQSPATASNRYRALQSFFRWAVEEEEIERSPMEHMKPPRVPVTPVPVLREDELAALFKACEGTAFADYRDMAIVRLLLAAGLRRAELGGIALDDLDLKRGSVRVTGKGGRVREVPFGVKAAQALDRYLRKARSRHPLARDTDALWLGHAGRMTDNGIYEAIERRAKKAGLEGVHPHQFRHTWAHLLSADGMQETQLMHLAGWSSTQMAQRYGASALGERARATYRRMSPGDKL